MGASVAARKAGADRWQRGSERSDTGGSDAGQAALGEARLLALVLLLVQVVEICEEEGVERGHAARA